MLENFIFNVRKIFNVEENLSACKVICWNVWSVMAEEKLRSLLLYIEDEKVDISCICETWFDSQTGRHTAIIKEAGLDIIHANRENKRGGGAAIIYKQSSKIKKGEASSTKFTSFEYAYCIIQSNESKILLICIYRLQEIACTIFCTEFERFIESIFHKNVKLDSDINKNYRPVNNLVFFSKMTERVVKKRTNVHMYVSECSELR